MRVFVVRHACAGRKDEWPGPDGRRPLDVVGQHQAEVLADVLERQGVRRLVSSPSLRCVETLGPLARRLDLTVERTPALDAGSGSAVLGELVADPGFDRAVLCTHGEVMQPFLERLPASGVPMPQSPAVDELLFKGTGWALDVHDGRVTSFERCAPVGRPECASHAPTGQRRRTAAEAR